MKSSVLFTILLMLAGLVTATPEDHAMCRAYASTQVSLAGRVAEWVGYPEGWSDMPADLINLDILPIPDETLTDGWLYSSFYDLKFSPSTMQLWVFPHVSFEYSTDANGNNGGTHDLCPVMIYDLNPKDR